MMYYFFLKRFKKIIIKENIIKLKKTLNHILNKMSFLFKFIAIILLYFSAQSSILKDNDRVSLVYYEYSYNLSQIDLDVKNRDSSILDSTSCHLAYIKNEKEEHKEIFDFYSAYLNRQWIFFADKEETINSLLKIDYDRKDIYLLGILIPKNLSYKIGNSHGIPIFEIDDNYTEKMENWDMRNSNKNIFFSLEITHAVEYYPETYFLLLSSVLLICSFGLLCYWKVKLKKVPAAHILNLHKVFMCLIYLNILLCFILVIKSLNIRGKKIYEDERESSILLDTALITLNGIHRTVFWFMLLLLSYGWNISLQHFNSRYCKFFLKMIIILFLLMSIDQIIDAIFAPISRLQISEIKNTFLYLFLIYIMMYKIDKNLNFLKLKIHYAQQISPQYITALNYKMSLFTKFRIIIITYFFVFLIVLILHKTAFYKYDEEVLESYDYLSLDCFYAFLLLIFFRPKELPQYYTVDLGESIDLEEGNIYNCNLPQYSEAHLKIADLTKNDVQSIKKYKRPIVIIGPNLRNSNNGNKIIMDGNNQNYSINNYFSNLEIGVINNK